MTPWSSKSKRVSGRFDRQGRRGSTHDVHADDTDQGLVSFEIPWLVGGLVDVRADDGRNLDKHVLQGGIVGRSVEEQERNLRKGIHIDTGRDSSSSNGSTVPRAPSYLDGAVEDAARSITEHPRADCKGRDALNVGERQEDRGQTKVRPRRDGGQENEGDERRKEP